jgi:hypothetical protein
MNVQCSTAYPNRIVLGLGNLNGPLTSVLLGAFNPSRDLQIYVDGVKQSVQSFGFDIANNRYLIFLENNIDLTGVIQVVHHMPLAPFQAGVSQLMGFGTSFGTFFAS